MQFYSVKRCAETGKIYEQQKYEGDGTISFPIDHNTKIVSEYDQEIPQSQTADNPKHREEEPLNHHETPGKQIKESNQLSLRNVQQNIEQLQTPTMGVTINKKSRTTEPPP